MGPLPQLQQVLSLAIPLLWECFVQPLSSLLEEHAHSLPVQSKQEQRSRLHSAPAAGDGKFVSASASDDGGESTGFRPHSSFVFAVSHK